MTGWLGFDQVMASQSIWSIKLSLPITYHLCFPLQRTHPDSSSNFFILVGQETLTVQIKKQGLGFRSRPGTLG